MSRIAFTMLFAKYTCCCLKTESLPLLQTFPRKVREWYNVESFFILRYDKFITVGILVHNFWSQGSIDTLAFFTDCTVLTDSVFYVLVAYFDESMASKRVYKPYKSWNTVGLTPI